SVILIVFLVGGALGLGIAAIRRDTGPFVIAALAGVMALAGAGMPAQEPLNTRALPFYYAMVVLAGAYGIGMIVRLAVVDLARAPAVLPAVGLVVAVAMLLGANAEITFIRGWATYNFSGYEAKSGAVEYRDLMNTLQALPSGRVLWEYSGDYERFGTTRSLELVPYWTKQPSMEGLLVESSITAPFHFIMQNETSYTGTGAVPGLRYPSFNLGRGLAHANLYDITYFVAYTDNDKKAASGRGLPEVASSGKFAIYRLNHPGIVS